MLRLKIGLLAVVMLAAALTGAQAQTSDPDDLPEYAFTADNAMLVYYPENWLSMPFMNTGVSLTNSEAIFESDGPVIPDTGEIYVQVVYSPRGPYLDTDDSINLLGVMDLVFSEFNDMRSLFGDVIEETLNDYETVQVSGALDLNGTPATALIMIMDRPDQQSWVLFTALMPEGELEDNLPVLKDILTSVELDATLMPQVSRLERITSANEEVSIANDENYFTQLEGSTNIAVATRFGLLGDQMFSSIEPGDLIYRVNVQPRQLLFSADTESIYDLIEVATQGFATEDTEIDIIEFESNGYPAVRASFTANPGELGKVDLLYLFVDYAPLERVLVLIAVTSEGQMTGFEPYLLRVLDGLEFDGEPVPTAEEAAATATQAAETE